ncbi:hypothetical protein LCGC14_2863640, partial [marine sediment metagenome]
WYVFMKQVAHGVYENYAGLVPFKRRFYEVVVERYLKVVPVAGVAHGVESPGHALCVAVRAPLAYLRATRNWVPRSLSPLYL